MNLVAPAIVKRYGKGTDSDATDAMIVNALDRQGGGPDDNSAQAGHLIAHTLTSEGFDASEDGTGRGTPLTAFNLRGREGGAMPEPGEVNIRAASGGSSRSYVAGTVRSHTRPGSNTSTDIVDGPAVRRLSPTECERLQDWPDGWTIPHGPSLADTRLRLEHPDDPQPDGPRYAACGDGVTASVAEWIGRRLLAATELADAA